MAARRADSVTNALPSYEEGEAQSTQRLCAVCGACAVAWLCGYWRGAHLSQLKQPVVDGRVLLWLPLEKGVNGWLPVLECQRCAVVPPSEALPHLAPEQLSGLHICTVDERLALAIQRGQCCTARSGHESSAVTHQTWGRRSLTFLSRDCNSTSLLQTCSTWGRSRAMFRREGRGCECWFI